MKIYLSIIDTLNNTLLKKIKIRINPYHLIALLFICTSYLTIPHFSHKYNLGWWSPETRWDQYIPFWPAFTSIYIVYYGMLIAPLFLTIKKDRDFRLSLSLVLASCVNYIFNFSISHTNSPRADLTNVDGFWVQILRYIYQADPAALYFPSLHVAQSLLIALFLLKWKDYGIYYGILSIPIILSTVFVKQHFVMDIVGGIVLALLLFFLVPKWHDWYKLKKQQ